MDDIELQKLYKKLEDEIPCVDYIEDTVAWYNNLIKAPLLNKEEEKILLHQISLGDKRARKIFIQRNLRLVRFIALKYIGRGLSLSDLIQEGNVGLIKAIDEYTVIENVSFSRYAYVSIESHIKRAIDEKVRLIALPVYLMNNLKDYNKKVRDLTDKLQRRPTYKEISRHYNIDMDTIIKYEKIYYDAYLMTDISPNCDDDSDLTDYLSIHAISQSNYDDINEFIDHDILYDIINKTKLTKNELLFLKLHYGLEGNEQYKQNQITKIMNLSPQRISQMKISAIKKLNRTAIKLQYIDKK